MKKLLFLSLLLLVALSAAQAQELRVTCRVNAEKAQADPQVFKSMETAIEEFMNNQKWTEDVFEENERIDVNIQVTISNEVSSTTFRADVGIQAVRPVFGTDYETPILTHLDKNIAFTFEQFQPLDYTENNFRDNLTHTLSFYAYLILGLDYDSFAPFGGEQHFQKAQNIINTFPQNLSGSFPGWTSREGNRNRYWMLENILNPSVRPFREAMYNYHRQGLDIMYDDVDAGKAVLMQVLETVSQVNKKYLNAMVLQVFANTKSQELIDIFKVSARTQKSRVYSIMSKIDPANANKYRAIGI